MADFNLLANHRDNPAVMNNLRTGQFRQDLCGCFDNCGVCVLTYFFPCVQFGMTAEGLGKNCCVYCCLFNVPIAQILVQINQREELREIRGIPGSCGDDCLIATFCTHCGVCQEATEMETIKTDMVNVLASANQGAVVIQTHMQSTGQSTQVTVSPGNMQRI